MKFLIEQHVFRQLDAIVLSLAEPGFVEVTTAALVIHE